ncbi:MAG: ABC transporter ATP-binding protein [Myxococcota bacterium]
MSEPLSQDLHEEEALGKAYDTQLMRRLWQYVKPYGRQIAGTLALVVPLFVLDLAPAWLIKQGLDEALHEGGASDWFAFLGPSGSVQAFVGLALLYLAISVLGSALQYLNIILMATTGQYAMRDLRRGVFAHIQSLHHGYFDRIPVGRLVTRASNDVENVAEMFSAGIVALVTDILKMIGVAVALFIVSPKLAAWTFVVVPLLLVAAVIFRLKVREAFRMVRVRIARINTHIQETITGMKVVQLFTREERNLADFEAMNASHRDAWKRSIRYDALLFSAVEVAQNITVTIIVWYGTGIAEAGVIYVFIDWMRRFFMPLRDLSAKYSVMQSAMASSERIFELLDTEPAVRDPLVPRELPASERRGGTIEFENVWFRYSDGDAADDAAGWILRDVSFRADRGDRIAFVGPTGAGKTTLIKLLIRFYDPTRGTIRIDGIDLRELRQFDLRRRIATVLQDVSVFSGSLADNIDLGREDIDFDTVRRCARAVQASEFIEKLPEGYDTEVRERGSNFSSGQRQLLSFARALAHGGEVLVLDEATSSIDRRTEALIQRATHVLMEGRTFIAVAHRLSTVRDVDRIFVLEAGRLAESGSHQALLARGGSYATLYRLQIEASEDLPGGLVTV